MWLAAMQAPLWVDETLVYWQMSGGLARIWSRSAQMPSSFAYLYILWFAKSVLGSREIALRIPSVLAMLAAAYLLYRAARELFGTEIAWITCILFCAHKDIVLAAGNARPYAFALLMTNLAIFSLVRWTARNEMRFAILTGAAAAGILYFHFLFGAILPAFAIYFLALRGRSVKASAAQLAAMLASFVLVGAPLAPRFINLFQAKQPHILETVPETLRVLQTLVPFNLLVIFLGTFVVAALLGKVRFPGRDRSVAALLCPLFMLVPAAILYGISVTTPVHVFIPRYCLVAVPGSALTWGLLLSWIETRWLQQICCAAVVTITVLQYFSLPVSRRQEMNFKQAHAFVNANVANDKAAVLICSAFVESDFEPIPTDLASENALVSQLSYYPVNAPVVLLPYSLNDETTRIGSSAVQAAAQRHQRFLALGSPTCYPTLDWLASYSRGTFAAQLMKNFDGIAVVEFEPVAKRE